MRQCPSCRTTYTDDSLSFCLADGTPLGAPVEEATVVLPAKNMHVDIPQHTPQSQYTNQPPRTAPSAGGKKIALVIGLVGTMMLVAIVGAGAILYFNRDKRTEGDDITKDRPTPSPSLTATPDQTNVLRDQIANLEKQIADQKKTTQPANLTMPTPEPSTVRTQATVNSPGDGFLALRTLPNSDAGERIAKIPHGATVAIGGCGPVVRPVSRAGRWCQASYNGMSGWVFDAYLTY